MEIKLVSQYGGHVLRLVGEGVTTEFFIPYADGMETAEQLIEAAYALAPGSPGERMGWFLDRLAEALL